MHFFLKYNKNPRIRTYNFLKSDKIVLVFWASYWQFRLGRFIISITEIKLLITRKIYKLGFGP